MICPKYKAALLTRDGVIDGKAVTRICCDRGECEIWDDFRDQCVIKSIKDALMRVHPPSAK